MSDFETQPSAHPTPGSRQAALLGRLMDAGYERTEPPLLSPASIFLDFSGEDIRSALFLTGDGAGNELCLRPEYTIPVCRAYLGSDRAGRQVSFAYCGPVFRAGMGSGGESVQSGLESFGRTDIAAADAEIMVLSMEAAAAAGASGLRIRMGDTGLLSRLFEAVDVPSTWQRRFKRGLDKGQSLDAILTQAANLAGDHSGVLAALMGTDKNGARALVEDLLSIAGITSVGGRSAAEIAERFLAQVAARSTQGFADEQRQVLRSFLAVAGTPDEASARFRALASDAKLDLGEAMDLFDQRANFIAAQGIELEEIAFEATFGRNLDYYTGFVFEAVPGGPRSDGLPAGQNDVVIGGGRYDRLAQSLGSPVPIAAVGAAIWVDRLAPVAGATS